MTFSLNKLKTKQGIIINQKLGPKLFIAKKIKVFDSFHQVYNNITFFSSLAFSVTIFCTEAALVILVLFLRRSKYVGGELGGPVCLKYGTSAVFFCLWILYLVMSSLEVYDVIPGF